MMRAASASILALLAVVLAGGPLFGQEPASGRRRVGVAFGGGSARGLAHVGIIRWFEEHHIPIDLVAGTSMGGLIGGSFASGMSSDEIARLLAGTDWDAMFGSSSFRYKNIRRKQDARAYPSRIEFGLKHGLSPPVAINNGQEVDALIARIAGAYMQPRSFDTLPTPFRCLAVDLVTAQSVVLDHGSLADAMRATMSLPGIFPPIEMEGRVLVDGGAMNNVPANVVRQMGADVAIAINVGYMGDKRTVNYSMLGLMGQTVDVMMQANTRAAMKDADIVINPRLEQFGSLDWRRNEELARQGYTAAEALKDKLLPLAVDDQEWAAYLAARQARRRTSLETPQFLTIAGAVPSDRERMERVLADLIGHPLDVPALETTLDEFTGLDRYETVGWEMVEENGRYGLRIRARPKSNAPPFLMLGVGLQNLTTDEFAFQLAGRYLTFDVLGSGSELRIDAAIGAQPNIGAELYRPIGKTALFAAAYGGVARRTVNFIQDDTIVAKYNATLSLAGIDGGVNVGRDNEVRFGFAGGHLQTSIGAGNPDLPELSGAVTLMRLRWLHDTQDSPIVPSGGARATGTLSHIFNAPDAPPSIETTLTNDDLTQAEIDGSVFWSLRGKRDRFFLAGGAGTSFGGHPLPNAQFEIGRPFHLSAYDLGEFRGTHYAVASLGYLRGVARLPDFMGGGIFLGGWVESGSAFDDIDSARLRTDVGVGAVLDTLVGPTILGTSVAVDGNWRFYVGVGRLF